MNYIRITVADISDCGINLMYSSHGTVRTDAEVPGMREASGDCG